MSWACSSIGGAEVGKAVRNERDVGLGAAAMRVWAALLEAVDLRLELFAIELDEERRHFVGIVVAAALAVFFSVMTFLCLNLLVLIAFWEQRLGVASMLAGGYFLFAVIAWWMFQRRRRRSEAPFQASRDVLLEDRDYLRSRLK